MMVCLTQPASSHEPPQREKQHYYPGSAMLDWVERERAVVLTTMRHPGDVLLSLFHYVRSHRRDPAMDRHLLTLMRFDFEGPRATSPEDPGGIPRLTNLAVHIYRLRPDLQERFPDVFGRHRGDFVRWLIQPGADEYALTREELAPILGSI
jgi:hypothetical protein